MRRIHAMYAASFASLLTATVGAVAGCSTAGSGSGQLGLLDPNGPTVDPGGQVGPRPDFGATVTQKRTPPAISGGTLVMAGDNTLVAADSDRDQVYIVQPSTGAVQTVALQQGDEPGRVAIDANGRAHVVLRGSGTLATIDVGSATVLFRRSVCAAPRGLAYDASSDSVHVACVGGELVTFPAAGGAPTRSLMLDNDLRDVVVQGSTLLVSRLRTAEVLSIASDGSIASRATPPASDEGATPSVAWRLFDSAQYGAIMIHQRGRGESQPPVPITPGGYSSGGNDIPGVCDRAIVESALTMLGNQFTTAALSDVVLPVDATLTADGLSFIVIAAGNAHTSQLPQVLTFPLPLSVAPIPSPPSCFAPDDAGGCPSIPAPPLSSRMQAGSRRPASAASTTPAR